MAINIERPLTFLFFILMSFTHVFALGDYLRLWVVIFICSFVVISIKFLSFKLPLSSSAKQEDMLLILFIMYLTATAIPLSNERTITYLLAYYFIFVVFFFSSIVLFERLSYNRAMYANFIGVTFVIVFVIIDFLSFNYFRLDVQEFLPRRGSGVTATTFGADGFRRSYGFSGEPGILVLYLNTMGLIGAYYAWSSLRRLPFIIFSCGLAVAWLTTFSAGGLGAIVIGVVVSSVLLLLHGRFSLADIFRRSPFLIIVVALLLFVLVPILFSEFSGTILDPMLSKLTFADGNYGSRRGELWESVFYDRILDRPVFGYGIGSAAANDIVIVSWYLLLWHDSGFIALFIISIFIFASAWRASGRHFGAFPFTVAVVAGAAQMMAVSTFFNPFLWVAILLARMNYARHR